MRPFCVNLLANIYTFSKAANAYVFIRGLLNLRELRLYRDLQMRFSIIIHNKNLRKYLHRYADAHSLPWSMASTRMCYDCSLQVCSKASPYVQESDNQQLIQSLLLLKLLLRFFSWIFSSVCILMSQKRDSKQRICYQLKTFLYICRSKIYKRQIL